MKLTSLIRLSFLPTTPDCGMLALRIWLGLSMFLLHGLEKLQNFGTMVEGFAKMGFPKPIAAAAIIAEGVMSLFLVVGFATRWAAAFLATTMAVAFFMVHDALLKGKDNGELAFIYFAGFVAIFLAGGGRWSVDSKLK